MFNGLRLMLSAWADDSWIIARNAIELETMVADLWEAASRQAGLEVRVPKRTNR